MGPLILIVVLLILIPVGFLMSLSIVAAIMGYLLKETAELKDIDSELIDVNL